MAAQPPRKRLIHLPVIRDHRGALGFAQEGDHIPFAIRRLYYLFDIPDSAERGGHAHLACERVLIALSGSVRVTVDDGRRREDFDLDNRGTGFYVPAGLWINLSRFAQGTVLVALASHPYDEADYIRDYDEFKAFTRDF